MILFITLALDSSAIPWSLGCDERSNTQPGCYASWLHPLKTVPRCLFSLWYILYALVPPYSNYSIHSFIHSSVPYLFIEHVLKVRSSIWCQGCHGDWWIQLLFSSCVQPSSVLAPPYKPAPPAFSELYFTVHGLSEGHAWLCQHCIHLDRSWVIDAHVGVISFSGL